MPLVIPNTLWSSLRCINQMALREHFYLYDLSNEVVLTEIYEPIRGLSYTCIPYKHIFFKML